MLAGTHYSSRVEVRDARDFRFLTGLDALDCEGSVAFSKDGAQLVTGDLRLFATRSWTLQWSKSKQDFTDEDVAEGDVEFAPGNDEFVRTGCRDVPIDGGVNEWSVQCTSARYATRSGDLIAPLPALDGDRARYSPDGHWLVSRHRLFHIPSGTTSELAAEARTSIFTPEGDVIAGEGDASLVRYCRSSR